MKKKSKNHPRKRATSPTVVVECTKSDLVTDDGDRRYQVLAGTLGTVVRSSDEIGVAGDGPGWLHVKFRALLAHGERVRVVRTQPIVCIPATHLKVIEFS